MRILHKKDSLTCKRKANCVHIGVANCNMYVPIIIIVTSSTSKMTLEFLIDFPYL